MLYLPLGENLAMCILDGNVHYHYFAIMYSYNIILISPLCFDVLISIIRDDVPDFVGAFREKCVKRNVHSLFCIRRSC